MMKPVSIAAAALLATSSVASAAPPEAKSEDTGVAIAIGGTVASAVLLVGGGLNDNGDATAVGLILATTAPAWGHYYAHDFLTVGTGVRLAGLAAIGMGAAQAFDETFLQPDAEVSSDAELTIGFGAVLFVTGAVIDIATTASAVRDYNENELQLAPTALKDSTGNTTPGFVVAGRF